jgi:hypothetical protein
MIHIDSLIKMSKMHPNLCKMSCQSISYCSSRSQCTNVLEREISEIQPSFIRYFYLIIINLNLDLLQIQS